nr:DUF1730 domain-containing protein [Pseudomonadota bacterium]
MFFPIKHLEKLTCKQNLNLFALQNVGQAESVLKESANKLKIWQSQGYAAEMSYMKRDVSLYASLNNILPSVKSVLTFIFPYQNKTSLEHLPREGFGRVAKYAWGEDYHDVIKKKLLAFVKELEQMLAKDFQFEYRVFADAVPILERALAAKSELGFIGKNSMLIRPSFGSYFFIAEVLCNIEFDEELYNFSPARIKA